MSPIRKLIQDSFLTEYTQRKPVPLFVFIFIHINHLFDEINLGKGHGGAEYKGCYK